MKLGDLVNSKAALESLLKNPLNITVGWELKTFVKAINPELTSFEEVNNEKIKEFGEEVKDEEGKSTGKIKVKEENFEEFAKQVNELLNKELEIKVPQIKIGDIKEVSLTTAELMMLDWLIVE